MWIKLKGVYGGDDDVRREEVEILRGQFDHIKMRTLHTIVKESKPVCVQLETQVGN